ncbi:MAG TPA: phosphotransferase family protein, partial [Brevundimonas sp.]|nr:phosphotransferase family protein [Brevundimonas sp.]
MTEILDAQSAFSGTREVDERYRLDEAALDAWLSVNVEGYAGPLTIRQFKGGQSNPTYELTTPERTYVLRRKPPGTLLASAHAVDREFTVISALHAQGFPVARPYALCTDEGVIGSIFYVMDKVEGRVFWDLKLPGLTPTERRAIYEAQTDTLAALHAFDPAAIGLSDYGKPGNYFARQVGRWTKQYRASEIEPIPAMDRLIAFLPDSLPPEGPTRIVHGDFRLDNMILDPNAAKVRAVLDWELSTLGDPMA